MNNWKKKTAIAALILLVTSVLISANYYRIRHAIDYSRSEINDIIWKMKSPGDSKITGLANNYDPSFSHLPKGFIQCGGILLYTGKTEGRMKDIISSITPYTRYYRISHLYRDLKKLNGQKSLLPKVSKTIVIPGSVDSLLPTLRHGKKPEMPYVRGIYFTGNTAGSTKTVKSFSSLAGKGINSIVFDVKDIPGIVSYRSSVPMVKKYDLDSRHSIDNINLLIREARKNRIYTIARIAVFRDHRLVKRAPQLAIQSKKHGGIWNRGKKELWCDPSRKAVQDYNISLAIELAEKGVDEIQFDYIRFPTVGDLKDADFAYEFGKMKKEEVIAAFLKRAYLALQPYNVRLSIDIFGVVAWGKEVDIRKTGQRIELLSNYCDCISPMLYPSHFNDDFDGHSNPADNPYYFIFSGNKRVIERLKKKNVIVRPWLQAFGWKVSNYNPDYIIKQMKASHDSGGRGFLFWNASNTYRKVYSALKEKQFSDSIKMAKLP